MIPETKRKGDLGATKVILDLVEKGYVIFTPLVCESLPFDIAAYKDGKMYRIQCKYSSDGFVKSKTSWADKNGSHTRKYLDTDFDYYGIYLPTIDKVVYPSVKLKGITIAIEKPDSAQHFNWWEDFLEFTDVAKKRSYKDFGYELSSKGKDNISARKVIRPTKEKLYEMLWEKPTSIVAKEFGVSDVAIAKWAKAYGIKKPPRGYWEKVYAGKAEYVPKTLAESEEV